MLGARKTYGRGFSDQDWKPGHDQVAILSYSLFANTFGGNPDVRGKAVRLDQRVYTVIGVLAPSFEFALGANEVDLWIPLPNIRDPKVWQFRMLATLRPGVGLTAALIACVKVANLLLARAASREEEFAIRRALGASRWRLMRQWTIESAILAVAGGALGLLITPWGILILRALSLEQLPYGLHIGLDGRLLFFTIAISAVVCLLLSLASGLIPSPTRESLRGPRRKAGGANALINGGRHRTNPPYRRRSSR
jgi:putative ABC transport system permease protein